MCLRDFGLEEGTCILPPGWKQAFVDQMETDKRAFFAGGGVIQYIPRGVSGYKELTAEELAVLPKWQQQRYYSQLRSIDLIFQEIESETPEVVDEL